MTRPTLLPGLRPLWRDRYSVQLGTDPGQAFVLEFPDPAAAKLLDLLDGSRSEQAIITEMKRIGVRADEARETLAALAREGLVVASHTLLPAALPVERRDLIATEATALALRFRERPATPAIILRRRDQARVIIAGDGPLADLLIPTLTDAGIGTLGRVCGKAGTARPVVSPSRSRAVPVDNSFVIQIGWMARPQPVGSRRRVPVLALGVRDGVAIVGPLVPRRGGPCLRCLDLYRTEADPAWPALAVQVAREPAPCAAATILTAAGFAASEVLAYVDGGEPTTIGTTVEINGVAPWRRRSWSPHERCDCTRRR